MGRQALKLPGKLESGKPTLPICSRHLRDGDPPAIAEQQRRQGIAAADKSPNQAQKGAIVMDTPQTTGVGSGDGARTGGCRPNIPDAS